MKCLLVEVEHSLLFNDSVYNINNCKSFMRSRLFAIFILILLLGLPFYAYWYFYRDQVSSIVFLSDSGNSPFTVHLRGTLDFSYLPFSDKIFEYQSTCLSSCIFSPIPPLRYTLTLSSSWMSTIEDVISLSKKEEFKYLVHLEKNPIFEKVGRISQWDQALAESLVENANIHFTGSFMSIAQIPSGKIYATRKTQNGSEVGILTPDIFSPLFSLPFVPKKAILDISGKFLILERDLNNQFLISLDGSISANFPYSEDVKIIQYSDNTWKILTTNWVFIQSSFGWEENPRFRDYIDLSPQYRLGYLAAADREKKSLQNIESSESLLLLLDRKSTTIHTLEKGREIVGFIFYENVPAYIDSAGDIWKITY